MKWPWKPDFPDTGPQEGLYWKTPWGSYPVKLVTEKDIVQLRKQCTRGIPLYYSASGKFWPYPLIEESWGEKKNV